MLAFLRHSVLIETLLLCLLVIQARVGETPVNYERGSHWKPGLC